MNNIQILRGADSRPVQQLTPDDSFVCTLKQMGEQAVRMTVSAVQPLDLRVGDHFEWQGVRYTLTDEPDYKRSEGMYTYTLVFYAPYHRLSYLLHKDEGSLTFPYDGNLEQQIDALYTSIGREASGFTVDIEPGIETAAEFRHIEFDKTYCLDALTRICEEFGTEWHIAGQAIRIGRYETTPAGLFRYGRGKGLYSLEKIGVSDASVVTRLYGFGSSDNLPQGYRTQTLEFLGVGGKSFLEKNIDKYGIREETVTFDDIYPHLEGASLSGVTVPPDIAKATGWTVTMKLPADCNDIVIEKDKSDPQIKFTSGALMGESFTITGLDAAAGRLDFNTSEDNGYKLPSQSRQPAVGDGFVLLGIVMPQSYVDRAEAELKARTQEELDRRCEKQYAYRLDIDPRYVRSEEIRVRVGDTLLVQESDETEPVGIRVSEVSYPLQDPEKLSLVLSDTPVYTSYSEKIENDIKDVTHEVINVYREARAFSRRAWRDAEELASMIDSLKADLVLVGNHAGQFAVGSTFTVNKSNDVNLFGCTPGTLQHAVYKGATDGVWSMKEANIILQPDIACYLYAKCSHTSGDGFYRVVPQRIDVEQEEGWYHFPVGVISSPFEGARVFNTTYGFTQLSGGSITTGRLQDPARRMVVDLDNGTITGPVILTAGTSLDQIPAWNDLSRKVDNDSHEMVRKNGIISSINLSQEAIKIEADKIRLIGETTLDGILSAGKIKAEYINVDNLTVRQLRTADSGARIEINQEQNVIAGFTNNNKEVFRIEGMTADDASLSITSITNILNGPSHGIRLDKNGLNAWSKRNGYGPSATYLKEGIELSRFDGYFHTAVLKPGYLKVGAAMNTEVIFERLPSGKTTDAYIKALPSGTVFIDSGQVSNGSAMLRIRVD